MQTLKLTVVLEDTADLAMEVHVVAPEHRDAATAPLSVPKGADDQYELGGYAGI